ncbi:MAG: SLBB domain-containing protein [Geminicoccaceae bacterium]
MKIEAFAVGSPRRLAFAVIAFLAVATLPVSEGLAREVFVRADDRDGRGFIFRRGADCYTLTLDHIVVLDGLEASEIHVYQDLSMRDRSTIVQRHSEHDLAILRHDSTEICDHFESARPMSVDRTKTYISVADRAGGSDRFYVRIRRDSGDELIIETAEEHKSLGRGMSGSLLYDQGEVVGMLTDVKTDDVKFEDGARSTAYGVVKSWEAIARVLPFDPRDDLGSSRVSTQSPLPVETTAPSAVLKPAVGVGDTITIKGAVKKPGDFALQRGRIPLRKAIQLAGGLLPTANTLAIFIRRSDGTTEEQARLTMMITPGDEITVAER